MIDKNRPKLWQFNHFFYYTFDSMVDQHGGKIDKQKDTGFLQMVNIFLMFSLFCCLTWYWLK